jgi:Ca2+-binding RTX toxin-like protein
VSLGVLLGCAAWLAIAVGNATASTVTFENGGGTLQVRADKDPVNNMQIGLVPGNLADYRITDSASEIADYLPPSCLRETAGSIRCPSAGVVSISVFLSNGSDKFSVLQPAGIPEDTNLTVRGGFGADQIAGRSGPGRESIFGNDGDDFLSAGCPGEGKTVNGGPGNDFISLCNSTTGARSGAAVINPFSTALPSALRGGTLVGEGGNDRLIAGPQNDRLKGGPGNDIAKGGPGNDIIDCGAGKHDLGVGGPGRDLGKNCERVRH